MSKKGVEELINRAVTDKNFRSRFFQEPEASVADHDISEDEVQLLKSIKLDDKGDFHDISALDALDPEIAKASIGNTIIKGCFTLFVRCYL